MKILVTGCCGYIGSMLVDRLLDEGYSVEGVDYLIYDQGPTFQHLLAKYPHKFNFHKLDVKTDYIKIAHIADSCDVLIPLAALVGMPICERDSTEAMLVNTKSIDNLVSRASPNQLIIYPNTNSGYGKSADICTETTPMNPISIYGRTKFSGERIVCSHDYSIVFRLATVFGPSLRMRLDLLVNDFVLKAFTYNTPKIYEKDAMRNYVHISDVVDAFIYAIKERDYLYRDKIYNLGNDDLNCSKEGLVNKINEIIPFSVVYNNDSKDPDGRDYVVSSEKLLKHGFKAKRTLEEGIQQLITCYQTLPKEYRHMFNN